MVRLLPGPETSDPDPTGAGEWRENDRDGKVPRLAILARDEHPSPDVRFLGTPPGVVGTVKDVDENKGVAGAPV